MARFALVPLVLVALGLSALPARGDFSYADFSSTNSTTGGQTLTVNGNASLGAGVNNQLQLTPANFFQSGSAFTTNAISLGNNASFSTFYQFRITNRGGIGDEDGAGADGIVFVVQTQANNVGAAGGGMGYQGIPKSIGIEFDTFNNGGSDGDGNHVAVDENGVLNDFNLTHVNPIFDNGDIWSVWVDYNGNTNGLEVRWADASTVRPASPGIAMTVNLPALLTQNNAFVGFTAGTGSGDGDQRIVDWQFRQSFNPIDAPAAPEPASLTLLGSAVITGLGYMGWRRRKQLPST